MLPFTWHKNQNPFLISHGSSFGAYHAVNIAFRHPHLFSRVLAFSGMYDMSNFFDGYHNDDIYFNTPSHFVPNLSDSFQINALNRMDIKLVIGEHDPNIENNRHLSRSLWSKGIQHSLHVWDGWSHDWPYWMKMMRQYISG